MLYKIKFHIGVSLNKISSKCWPDIYSWIDGTMTTLELIKSKDHKGCVIEAEENGICWCGKYTSKEYKEQQKNLEIDWSELEGAGLDKPFRYMPDNSDPTYYWMDNDNQIK